MTQIMMRSLVMAVLVLTALSARADDKPELTLSGRSHLGSQVREGDLIANGKITYQGRHSGFKVWLEARKSGEAPDHYIVTGTHDGEHELRVVIGRDGWRPDDKAGNGIIILTGEPQAEFDVVSDRDQTVAADEYRIMVNGAYQVP